MRLPEFGVRRPVTNIMIFFGILLLGIVSFYMLPVDMLPEIEPPAISVITDYPGSAAEDVEDKVTRHIENQLSIVDNLDTITSISVENQSIVTCKFDWGTNLDEASNNIRERLEFAKRDLPDDAEDPMLFKFNTAMLPILFLGFTAEESYPRLHQFVDQNIADRLKNLPGVGAVQILGGLQRQINVRLDRERIQAYKLSVQQIAQAIRAEHFNLPAGDIKMGKTDYLIRVLGEFQEPYEMNDIIVGQNNGALIYLRDVAQVEDSHKEETIYIRVNGRPALMVLVQKRSGTNTVNVATKVKKRLEALRPTFPKDVNYQIIMDSSRDILLSVQNLSRTLWWALVAVTAVVLFFLRRAITSLIILLTIPFSLIIAFIFMYGFGLTINILSLSSLIIAMGMVVDNSIVVLENITRHVGEGERPSEASIFASSEVGLAITASSLTTVAIFIPLIFLKGITGIFFKDMAIAVSTTIMASLFTALTLTPMLSSKLLRAKPRGGEAPRGIRGILVERSERVFEWLENRYGRLLNWALHHRKLTITIATLLFFSSLMLLRFIGTEFMPEHDTTFIRTEIELPVGARVEETDTVMKEVENIFRESAPEMEAMFARAGEMEKSLARAFGSKMGSHIGQAGTKIVEKKQRKRSSQEIAAAIREKVRRIPGLKRMSVETDDPTRRIVMGGGKPLSLEVLGHDLGKLSAFAVKVKGVLERIPGAADVSMGFDPGKPEIHVRVDRERASGLGLNVAHIAQTLRANFYGYEAAKFIEAGDEYDIFLRLREPQRRKIWDLENTPIALHDGDSVKLKNIARVEYGFGALEIDRKNQQRVIRVEANVRGRPMGDIAKDLDREIRKLSVPTGIGIEWGGEVEEQRKSFRDLLLLFCLGVLLVYMVMASQFESFLHPFIIMFSVPFLFIGVLAFLFLWGATFNLISIIGLIMLVGIVVNNAIVLVDYINILRKRGNELFEAIITGGRRRLRPVLMTALTTMFGVFPMIVSTGEGAETWRPLGLAVFGGLLASTLITLVFVPTLYYILERRREARRQAIERGT
jgi:hydrophobe/amphiphile efflux-1 (HAE1) family protein